MWSAAVLAAVLLGIYADIGENAPEPWTAIPQYALPWVGLAVLWGAAARRPAVAGLAGVFGIMTGLAAWLAFKAIT